MGAVAIWARAVSRPQFLMIHQRGVAALVVFFLLCPIFFVFLQPFSKLTPMKNKNLYLTIEKAKAILANEKAFAPDDVQRVVSELEQASTNLPPWLVIVLKVLAYALGLILAGAGSMTAVSCIFGA